MHSVHLRSVQIAFADPTAQLYLRLRTNMKPLERQMQTYQQSAPLSTEIAALAYNATRTVRVQLEAFAAWYAATATRREMRRLTARELADLGLGGMGRDTHVESLTPRRH
jgi:uncharacterized protein YjiS (DUF1127 family)